MPIGNGKCPGGIVRGRCPDPYAGLEVSIGVAVVIWTSEVRTDTQTAFDWHIKLSQLS